MTEPAPTAETPKLKPANENPWYILMTLHGEQPIGDGWRNLNIELLTKNRLSWNKWASRGLSDATREKLLSSRGDFGVHRFTEDELTPHSDPDHAALEARYRQACLERGAHPALPMPRNRNCDLSNIKLDRLLGAQGFLFLGDTDLSGASFASDVYLSDAAFLGIADLSGVTFSSEVILARAIFGRYALFTGATFSKNTDISNVTFTYSVDFSDSYFLDRANFSGATFSGDANISGATFADITNFSTTVFRRSVSFADATFYAFPPNFHEATLHSDTDWVGARWPAPPLDIDNAKRHVRYYQRLKQVMEALKKHEDELDFFAREMKAQRVVDGKWSGRWALNGLYGALSDYGRSVLFPTFYLIISIAAFFAFLTFAGECLSSVGGALQCDYIPAEKALGLSLTSALGFLPLKKEIYSDLSSLSSAAHAIMAVETLVSFALLFLIGLGLRNRFRMK